IAALKSGKARLWIEGRRKFPEINIPENKKVIWFHCASLGEFEQGRPLIEQIKSEFNSEFILVTFFSPSGYEVRKNYALADFVCYLPTDLPGNARRFIKMINPALVVFVKYEFWAGYLSELKLNNIPAYLVSARFRPGQFLLSPGGGWIRKQLSAFRTIFVQDENSKKLIADKSENKIVVSGDTRFDRVLANAANPATFGIINALINNRIVFVAGSTWADDEKVIFPINSENVFTIVAPHEINESHINSLESICPQPVVRYSQLNENNSAIYPATLIIDNIGMLMSVYKLADITYVGGAFHKQLHNILEPAAMGVPVIFGPFTEKFPEGDELCEAGGGFKIADRESFMHIFNELINKPDLRNTSGKCSSDYVQKNKGATELIMKELRSILNTI
ncbi:MAG: 3-deoxy-D-manno-octulosonic acid transferase, partial [Bacteroidetes bacterium]|nr:3-deoxy-D-manno-octulosonic acid transferase [Bacteroidota bacterium]